MATTRARLAIDRPHGASEHNPVGQSAWGPNETGAEKRYLGPCQCSLAIGVAGLGGEPAWNLIFLPDDPLALTCGAEAYRFGTESYRQLGADMRTPETLLEINSPRPLRPLDSERNCPSTPTPRSGPILPDYPLYDVTIRACLSSRYDCNFLTQ
jgi:hypothetical protein